MHRTPENQLALPALMTPDQRMRWRAEQALVRKRERRRVKALAHMIEMREAERQTDAYLRQIAAWRAAAIADGGGVLTEGSWPPPRERMMKR